MRTSLPVVAMAALLFTSLTGGAASAQYGPEPSDEPAGTVSVSEAELSPGGELVITGEGWAPGTEVLGVLVGPNGDPVADGQATITVAAYDTSPGEVIGQNDDPVVHVRATTTVAADGTFRLVIPIPADAPCGDYIVTVTGTAADGSPRRIGREVAVDGCPAESLRGGLGGAAGGTSEGADGASGGGLLAFTGLQLGAMLALALALLALGTVAVRAARRHRTA